MHAKDFFDAWVYVPLLLTGTVFSGLSSFIGCLFTAVKKTKSVAATTVLSALINTVLNFILIPSMGAMGAALATLAGYMILGGIRIYRMRGFVSVRVNWKREWISYAVLLAQSIVATAHENLIFQLPFFILIVLLHFPLLHSIFSKFCTLQSSSKYV